jgi:hypothetical protein
MRTCECGNQVANNARSCPKCGHRFTSVPAKFLAWFIGIIIVMGVLAAILAGNRSQNALTSNTSPAVSAPAPTNNSRQHPAGNNSKQRPITESERTYFGAAGSYLETANAQGTNLARTMAGASDGSSSLGDIREALLSAKRVENAGYHGDYKNRINGDVPSNCVDLNKNIDEIHRLFQSAMNEFLEYWKDQNTAHIESGNATLKRSIVLMNATINQTNAKMKTFTPHN